jgi:hypothetical protein
VPAGLIGAVGDEVLGDDGVQHDELLETYFTFR